MGASRLQTLRPEAVDVVMLRLEGRLEPRYEDDAPGLGNNVTKSAPNLNILSLGTLVCSRYFIIRGA
jgi:hypothetical protein